MKLQEGGEVSLDEPELACRILITSKRWIVADARCKPKLECSRRI